MNASRLLRFGALVAAVLLIAFSGGARAAEPAPTVVLVHGAFASPDGWSRVAGALHKDGYRTATPALGLLSTSGDVDIVRATLDAIPGDKILVGHSYGGFVITNAASGRNDVRGLVYTAAPGHRRSLVLLRHRRPAVLPRRLRPGPQPEARRRDRGAAASHEPGALRQPVGARCLARGSVVVRGLGP
jgi:pimeloyl-ACP methyl ester carboxylesterase